MNKYRNIKTVIDGITFDSKKEAARYLQLRLLQKGNIIHTLTLQTRHNIVINGIKICAYVSDFDYYDNEKNQWVTEDCKGVKTAAYRIKNKLMKAVLGIDILET